ncbi:MAG TPA: DUF1592 domain-containing protein [Polyangia bacterium]|nr:DUF1592 domain-containing protein [Polyangia bacterium]
MRLLSRAAVSSPLDRFWRAPAVALVGLTLSAVGCSGAIGDPSDPSGGGGPGTGIPGGPSNPGNPGNPGDPSAAGLMPLQRLTNREYNNTVRDLLGDTSQPASQFATDRDPTFVFRRPNDIAVQDATLLRTAAESLAAAAVKNLQPLLSCNPATGTDACAQQFIASFGQRAFRRPLATTEVDRLTRLYNTGRTTLMLSFADAIGLVIEGVLQSSEFLFHWEAAPTENVVREGAVVRLGPYQIASRLSYFIWGSMPDDALLSAAASGALETPAGVETQARRLLADAKAKETLSAFVSDLMELDMLPQKTKDATAYPQYTAALQAAMVGETAAFTQNAVFGGDGKLATLLGAKYSYINKALGDVYGTPQTSTDLTRTDLNPAQRAGLLTEPSFLALTGATDGSHPVRRGHAIYTKLLCHELPPPPANVPLAKPASSGGTTRQRFTEHDSNTCAAACHGLMDPIGFAFENYDGIGQYRTMDNGQPVDATGTLELDGTTHNFNNAVELAGVLAGSAEVQQCFARQWLRYALYRQESDADAASLATAASHFTAAGGKFQDLMVAIATTRSFRYRTPSPGEVLP